jgi:hypothetical protein
MADLKVVKKKQKPLHADTVITVVIDASGSMSGITSATLEGYNSFIAKQREEEGKVLVSLVLFDTEWVDDHYNEQKLRIVRPYTALPLEQVPELTSEVYHAHGGTPLRDAVGYSIGYTDEILQRIPKKETPDALMVVITDGGENQSKNFGSGLISEMVKAREQAGWTFIYMGANQDSWSETQGLGFSVGNVMNYAAHNIKEGAFDKIAVASNNYRSMSRTAKAKGLVGSYTTTAFFADAGVVEDQPVSTSLTGGSTEEA